MPGASDDDGSVNTPTLLTLPGEIRDQIWKYALPTTVPITKTRPCPTIPALTLACRQTFCETITAFIVDTDFPVLVVDWDGSFVSQMYWCLEDYTYLSQEFDVVREQLVQSTPSSMNTTGVPNWPNLLAWAKAEHGCPPRPQQRSKATGDGEVGFAVLNMTNMFARLELPWEELEEALEEIHVLAKRVDARWA